MPSLEDIQQFDRHLMELGDEPAVLAEWGETYEPAQAPESGLADDLSDLLGGGEEPGGDEQSADDFLRSFADSIEDDDNEDLTADQASEPEADIEDPLAALGLDDEPDSSEPDADSGLEADSDTDDFSADFGAFGFEEGDLDGEPSDDLPEDLSGEPSDDLPEDLSGELSDDPFGAPSDDQPEDLLGDLDDAGELGDLGDLDNLDDIGDIGDMGDLDDMGETGAEDELPELGDIGDISDLGDLDDIGDIGDLDLDDETDAEPEPPADEPETEPDAVPEPPADEPETDPDAEPEIDIDTPVDEFSLDDFDLDEFNEDDAPLDLEPPEDEIPEPEPEPEPELPGEPAAPEGAEDEPAAPEPPAEAEAPESDEIDELDDLGDPDDLSADDFGDGFDLGADFGDIGDFDDLAESAGPEPDEAEPDEATPAETDLDDIGAEIDDIAAEPEEFLLDDEADEFTFSDEDDSEAAAPIAEEYSFDDEDDDAEEAEEVGDEEGDGPDDEFESDEFSLGDFGAEFGVLDDGVDSAEGEGQEGEDEEADEEEAGAAAFAQFEISERDFERVKQTLDSLPLNLKIAAEQIIGESKGSPKQQQNLVRRLIEGTAPKQLAELCGNILGKKINIPKDYRKKSGVEFEEEQRSLSYRFRKQVLPVLKVAALAGAILGLVVFLSYRFVYRPVYAELLYRQGHELIPEAEYSAANQRFDRAFSLWRRRPWFYRYAEAFAEERQYSLAAGKYQHLLMEYPFDKRGFLDYSALESTQRFDFETADEILETYRSGYDEEQLLEIVRQGAGQGVAAGDRAVRQADRLENAYRFRNYYDIDVLIAQGDNFMLWADREDTARYEDARLSYATAIEVHGDTDRLLMRMLLYFIRTDNYREVVPLKDLFQNDLRAEIDPYIYAELGGYLLDYDELDDAGNVLHRVLETRFDIPELHFHLARYFSRVSRPTDEQTALNNAISLFEQTEPLTPRQMGMLVDTYGRAGRYHYEREDFLLSEQHFRDGISHFEQARSIGFLEPEERFGSLYAGLGDIHYYIAGELDAALRRFREAEAAGYRTRELSYKKGFVHYNRERFEEALDEFMNAAGSFSANPNLLFATANTLYNNENYFSAEGYFFELRERTEGARSLIRNLLVDEDPRHRNTIEYLIRVNNNLGVTQQRIGERTGDPDKRSEGMVQLTRSMEYAENYRRDPQTGRRTATTSLAFLNMRETLYPRPEFELQIYQDIPRDFEDLAF